jgi:hypothetical protein
MFICLFDVRTSWNTAWAFPFFRTGFSMLPQFPSLEGAGFPGEPSKLDKPKKKRKKRAKKDQLVEGAPATATLPSLSLGLLGSWVLP